MSRVIMIVCLTLVMALLTGCALIDKIAPSRYDESGNRIPGTHEASPLAQDAAGAIPYGGVALSVLLLVTNVFEKFKSYKTTKGLMATIRAIELAAKDPETKEAIAKLKVQLSTAHQSANVQPLINRLLAQLKFKI